MAREEKERETEPAQVVGFYLRFALAIRPSAVLCLAATGRKNRDGIALL